MSNSITIPLDGNGDLCLRYCDECVHCLIPDGNPYSPRPPTEWLCKAAPVSPGYRFLSRTWTPHLPFRQCSYINPNGTCPMYEDLPAPSHDIDADIPF